jgi:hypothetical protein
MVLGLIAALEMGLPVQKMSKEQPVQQSNTSNFAISDMKILDMGLTSLTLDWTPVDQTEVATYKIYNETSLIAIVSEDVHMYKVTGLKVNTWYQFSVEACNSSGNCGNGHVIGVKTLSAQEAIESIINEINNLVSTRTLNQKQSDALIKELGSIYQLDKDNTVAEVNHLQASINNVNSLINSGILSPEVGRSLVDTINEVIKNIEN